MGAVFLIGSLLLANLGFSATYPPPKQAQAQASVVAVDQEFWAYIEELLYGKKPEPPKPAPTPAPPQPPPPPAPAPQPVVAKPVAAPTYSGLTGSMGWIAPGNNCVTFVRLFTGRAQNGNAGTWQATSSTPAIGKIMIFRPGQQGAGRQGHVGVVVGIGGNTIYLAHANFPGRTAFVSTGMFY